MAWVVSSNLQDVWWRMDPRMTGIRKDGMELGVLTVQFHGGRRYAYTHVPRLIYEEILRAPSKGKYFHWHVRDKFPYHRLA